MKAACLLFLLLVIAPPLSSATTYFVRPDSTGDFPTVQAAMAAVHHGDIILLTDGRFVGAGNRNINFGGKAVIVRSESGDPDDCIIDCEESGRAFVLSSGEGPGSVIEGLTITGGYSDSGAAIHSGYFSSPVIRNCVFVDNSGAVWGGAIVSLTGSCPSIVNCRFSENQGDFGGALMCREAVADVSNCVFTGNRALFGGAVCFSSSGGASLNDCTFTANASEYLGGGIDGDQSSFSMSRCTFVANNSASGSCLCLESNSVAEVDHCLLSFGFPGQAVDCREGSSASLTCCDIYGNRGGDWVGAIYPQLGVNGNISADPMFCADPSDTGDCSLIDLSPCGPANAECGQIGAWPVGCTGLLVCSDGSGDYPTIQSAIDAAGGGEIVLLEPGVFRGSGNCALDFLGKALELRSLHSDPTKCVIDCQHGNRAMTFHSGEDELTRVRAITIRNGAADRGAAVLCVGASPEFNDCVLHGNEAVLAGGAFHLESAAPRLVGCTIVASAAPSGGTLRCTSGADPVLERTIIAFGSAGEAISCDMTSGASLACCDLFGNAGGDWTGCIASQLGFEGNICEDPLFCSESDFGLLSGSPCIADEVCGRIGALDEGCGDVCVVSADGTGDYVTIQAAIDVMGEGGVIELTDGAFVGPGNHDLDFHGKAIIVRARSGNPQSCVIDCQSQGRGFIFQSGEGWSTRIENVSVIHGHQTSGAAAFCIDNSSPTFSGCAFRANSVGGGTGGAVFSRQSQPRFVNCTFAVNAAGQGGGLAFLQGGNPVIENCIIAFNTNGGSIFCYGGSEPLLYCSDIYGNTGGDWVGVIADQLGQNGNTSEDPLFCNFGGGDYRLQADSPCAPFTPPNEECGLVGACEVGCWSAASDLFPVAGHLKLLPVTPNPFHSSTVVTFVNDAYENGRIELGIYSVAGRRVKVLLDERGLAPGERRVMWNGMDEAGIPLEAGIYFCRLSTGGWTASQRVLVVR